MTLQNLFSGSPIKRKNRTPLFCQSGTKNKILREVRETVSNLTDENLSLHKKKLELKTFNAILGRQLRDTNVDKLDSLISSVLQDRTYL